MHFQTDRAKLSFDQPDKLSEMPVSTSNSDLKNLDIPDVDAVDDDDETQPWNPNQISQDDVNLIIVDENSNPKNMETETPKYAY